MINIDVRKFADCEIYICWNDTTAYNFIKRNGEVLVSITVIDDDPDYITVFCDEGSRADEVTNIMYEVCSRMDPSGTKFLFDNNTFDEKYDYVVETFLERLLKEANGDV